MGLYFANFLASPKELFTLLLSSCLFLLVPYLFLSLSYALRVSLDPGASCYTLRASTTWATFSLSSGLLHPYGSLCKRPFLTSFAPALSLLSLTPACRPAASALSSLLELLGTRPHGAPFATTSLPPQVNMTATAQTNIPKYHTAKLAPLYMFSGLQSFYVFDFFVLFLLF